jgi:hypothetical protein
MAQITLNSSGITSSGALALQSNGTTTAVTVDTSQNVGIGTTSPTARLHVQSTGGTVFNLKDNTASGGGYANIFFSSDTVNANGYLGYNNSTNAMNFGTNNTERARIDSSGRLLVNTTTILNSSDATVSALAQNTSTVGINAAAPNSFTSVVINAQTVTTAGLGFYYFIGQSGNGTSVTTNNVLIYGNGNIVNVNNSYGSASDIKLKENIVDATPKLANLMQVKVRNYNLKSDPSHKQLGVIAQELEQVFPAMIDEAPDKDIDGNALGTTTKQVKYSVFVPMLIKAMQEQQAIIESLKARLDAANL